MSSAVTEKKQPKTVCWPYRRHDYKHCRSGVRQSQNKLELVTVIEGERECDELQGSDKESREHIVTLAFHVMHQQQHVVTWKPCLITVLHGALALLCLSANISELDQLLPGPTARCKQRGRGQGKCSTQCCSWARSPCINMLLLMHQSKFCQQPAMLMTVEIKKRDQCKLKDSMIFRGNFDLIIG